ncbi:MAG: hypothetical protein R3E48_19655 [Burkholderiaceae bacterium]
MGASHSQDSIGSPDIVTLSWCAGEIREALAQTEALLAKQLETDPQDLSCLRAAKVSLHQARGALYVVDLSGASRLCDEAEATLDAVDAGSLVFNGELMSRLSRAFGAIGDYLDELLQGEPNQPLHLFPYLKALLEARKDDKAQPGRADRDSRAVASSYLHRSRTCSTPISARRFGPISSSAC